MTTCPCIGCLVPNRIDDPYNDSSELCWLLNEDLLLTSFERRIAQTHAKKSIFFARLSSLNNFQSQPDRKLYCIGICPIEGLLFRLSAASSWADVCFDSSTTQVGIPGSKAMIAGFSGLFISRFQPALTFLSARRSALMLDDARCGWKFGSRKLT